MTLDRLTTTAGVRMLADAPTGEIVVKHVGAVSINVNCNAVSAQDGWILLTESELNWLLGRD